MTFNLADFPGDILSLYGIEAIHPDDFVLRLIEAAPEVVCSAVRRHRRSLKKPQKSPDEYLGTLEHQRLPQTVEALRKLRDAVQQIWRQTQKLDVLAVRRMLRSHPPIHPPAQGPQAFP